VCRTGLPPLVVRFAEHWNGRDLEGLLSLYDEAAEMTVTSVRDRPRKPVRETVALSLDSP
jgi:hypothetical protein